MKGQPVAAQGLLAAAHPGQGGGQGAEDDEGPACGGPGPACGGPPGAGWRPRAEDDEGPARGGPGPACGGPPGAGCEADTWLFHWEAYAWLRLADALLGRRHRSSHWAWLFIVRTSQRKKTASAHVCLHVAISDLFGHLNRKID